MSRAVHQLAVHTVRNRESGVRAGRVTPPNRPFLEPSVRGRSRVWGGGTGLPAQSVRLSSGLPFVHRWIVMFLSVDPGSLEARTFFFPLLVSADSNHPGESRSDGKHESVNESPHD